MVQKEGLTMSGYIIEFGLIPEHYTQYAAEIQPLDNEDLQECRETWEYLATQGNLYAAKFLEVIATEEARRVQADQ
jgi:hypothetical protein